VNLERKILAAFGSALLMLLVGGVSFFGSDSADVHLLTGGASAVAFVLAFSVNLAIRRDVREHRRLITRLERSNRDLDQFAYVASHDLKAPLRGIAALSEWIEEDLGQTLTSDTREHLRLLRGRVTRMEGLINGILAYARAGRARESYEVVDVAVLIQDMIGLMALPGAVSVRVAPGAPRLTCQRVPLQQVLGNLIGNAVKHGAAPGEAARVEISFADGGAYHIFTVRDHGPGIERKYHERVFRVFQTLASRDRVEGTGIGLAVVQKLVQSEGGRVWIESEPGSGARFHFTWPKTESASQ